MSACVLDGGEAEMFAVWVDPDYRRQGVGRLLVDFNMAYNPYCAYNPPHSLFVKMGMTPRMLYSCPIPPKENHLSVPIQAGEMKPVGPWVEEEYE